MVSLAKEEVEEECGPTYDPLEGLTEEERAAYDEMVVAVARVGEEEEGVDVGAAVASGWLSPATYCRYLRARGWRVDKAATMLVATLKWRAEYRPEEIRVEDVWDEFENEGKMYVSDRKDDAGRPIIYQRPGLDNTTDRETKVRYLVYTVEKALASIDDPAVETMTIITDFGGYSQLTGMRNIKISKDVASILQNHYPERLGAVYMLNNPWVWKIFWAAVSPFVDRKTRDKITFCGSSREPIATAISSSNLELDFGGLHTFEYDPHSYASWVDQFVRK